MQICTTHTCRIQRQEGKSQFFKAFLKTEDVIVSSEQIEVSDVDSRAFQCLATATEDPVTYHGIAGLEVA